MFTHSALSLTKFSDMPEHCPVCGQSYEPEPGFYYGAMYISFGFAVAIFTVAGVLLYYLAGDPPLWVYITTVAVATLVTLPLVFRYSRGLMLYLFGGVRFDPRWQTRGAAPRVSPK
ncbi:hypothetical protein GCM10027048_41370 [Hymenobacter coalescens]